VPPKNEGQEDKMVLSGGGCLGEWGGHKERGNEDKYGGYILYSCMKIKE
jgi:hypothetical protein